ncbi:hypothetical protein ACWEQL_28230, partial [Kitasatospora sp. NPDC004240]
RALAAQPATAPGRLARYAAHPDEDVRRAAAVHRATPEPAVTALAVDASTAVRRALAAREDLPRPAAAVLLADPEGDVRLTMARRVGALPEDLDALVGDPDPRVRRVLSALGRTSEADLSDPDARVRRAAVERRRHLDLAAHLPALARDEDPGVRELAAARWRNHDPDALAVLAADPVADVRAQAAANWFTPVEALTALGSDPDPEVLRRLAGNRLAPPSALTRLVDTFARQAAEAAAGGFPDIGSPDDRSSLIHAVLRHPATPPGELRRLHALDILPGFHPGNAMSQPNWPPDLLISFGLQYCASTVSGEEERAHFDRITEAAETEPLEQVLAEMVAGPIYYLRAAVANRHTPPQALARFVREGDPELENYHLEDLAQNPALPQEIMLDWVAQGTRCGYLLRNPELPVPVIDAIARRPDEYFADEARDLLEVRRLRAAARHERTEEPC